MGAHCIIKYYVVLHIVFNVSVTFHWVTHVRETTSTTLQRLGMGAPTIPPLTRGR